MVGGNVFGLWYGNFYVFEGDCKVLFVNLFVLLFDVVDVLVENFVDSIGDMLEFLIVNG